MASDEDDFGAYDPTTPAPKKASKSSKPNGRSAVAGPSSKPIQSSIDLTRSNASDEEVTEIEAVQERSRSKPSSRRTASREPHNTSKTKTTAPRGKGQGKTRSPSPADIEMFVDEPNGVADEDIPGDDAVHATAFVVSHKRARDAERSASWKKREDRFRREVERLQERLKGTLAQRDHFAQQLKETFAMRYTEVENDLQTQKTLYENRLQTQEELIQELTSQLARVDEFTRVGKTTTLHFVTRETADEERNVVERQIEVLKRELAEKDQEIQKRDMTIAEHAAELRNLKLELTAEIERSKSLVAAQQRSFTKNSTPNRSFGQNPAEGAKAVQTHKLLEDLTNFLVIDCKCEVSDNEDIYSFRCVHAPPKAPQDNFTFNLRTYMEPSEEDPGEKVEKVAYSLIDTGDQEMPEFLENIEHMKGEFTFQRDQLDVFLFQILQARFSGMADDEEQ